MMFFEVGSSVFLPCLYIYVAATVVIQCSGCRDMLYTTSCFESVLHVVFITDGSRQDKHGD